jgi:hypothetical protein
VLSASPTLTGTVTGGTFSGSGASLTSLNAGNISTGTLPVLRGGTGVTTSTGTGSVVLSLNPTFAQDITVPGQASIRNSRHVLTLVGFYSEYRVGSSTTTDVRIYFRNLLGADNVNMFVNTLTSANDASDDRIKTNEVMISNALETLLKLKPQVYDKHSFEFDSLTPEEYSNTSNVTGYVYSPSFQLWRKRRLSDESKRESGFIIQDIWYEVPELRHTIRLADDANPVDIIPSDDIQIDPDYDKAGWGQDSSHLMYQQFIPYLVKGIQEVNSQLQAEKNKVATLEAQLASVLARLDALESSATS